MIQTFETQPAIAPAQMQPARENPILDVVRDLVQHARNHDLALADELLTDILAKLNGWPVEELNRLP